MSAPRRARAALGRAYARAWGRAAPRSARALPRLPAEPVSRRYGLDRGRPIDRVHIERFVERHAADLRGRGVEIHEPTYLERFGSCERVDVLDADPASTTATIRGDLSALPAGAFDCFVCTQTISLVDDPATALRQARDALRPGGVLLVTVPGISQIWPPDEFPDLWRFTAEGLRRLAAGAFDRFEVEAHGNVQAAAAFLYGLAEHEVDPGVLERDDPAYPLVVTLRAVRG
ncbi:MAG TPA: methyltransferase domain-containing protein [Capillimicrobium sp.]|nr:methyltransferase domain-containing protein [Capillimicrobium sp.]